MSIDTSSILAIALLVFAASVAAYLLSHWSKLFGGRNTLTQWASGIGVVALLAAASVYFLSVISPAMLKLGLFEDETTVAGTARVGEFPARQNRGTPEPATSDVTQGSRVPSAATGGAEVTPRAAGEMSSPGQVGSDRSGTKSKSATNDPRGSARAAHLVRTLHTNPWGATECVLQIQPDPAQPDLWWLENECDVAVGIVVATCSGTQTECEARRSTSWTYDEKGMYLPSKQQRSVTYAEQTQRGQRIRFIACVVTSQRAVDLLGSDGGAASRHWREALANSISYDGCIAQVQRLSAAGNRTRAPIEDVVGASVPGVERQTRER